MACVRVENGEAVGWAGVMSPLVFVVYYAHVYPLFERLVPKSKRGTVAIVLVAESFSLVPPAPLSAQYCTHGNA